jgi:hypothetical protein
MVMMRRVGREDLRGIVSLSININPYKGWIANLKKPGVKARA